MVGPSVSPLGSMLRAQAIVGRRLLVAAWRRELGTLPQYAVPRPRFGGQTGDQQQNIDVQNAHSTCRVGGQSQEQLRWASSSGPENLIWT